MANVDGGDTMLITLLFYETNCVSILKNMILKYIFLAPGRWLDYLDNAL